MSEFKYLFIIYIYFIYKYSFIRLDHQLERHQTYIYANKYKRYLFIKYEYLYSDSVKNISNKL